MAAVTGPEGRFTGGAFPVAGLAVSVKGDLKLHGFAFAFLWIMAILAPLDLVAFPKERIGLDALRDCPW